MTITFDGNVTPCCRKDCNFLANINGASLKDIWNNQFFKFQRKMLNGVKEASKACADCTDFFVQMKKEDMLENSADICRKRYDSINEAEVLS
jgi:hypothetical protein